MTAPAIFEAECFDFEGDGQQEIVCGSSAPDNGNRAEDGTDDAHSYIFAFAADGRLLWKTLLGPELSLSRPLIARLDRSGRAGLFACVTFSGEDSRREQRLPDVGLIVRLDAAGTVIRSYPVAHYIRGCVVADLDADGEEELIVALTNGELRALRPDLTPKAAQSLDPEKLGGLRASIAAVGDLNRDGRLEVAVVSGQHRLTSPAYLGRPGEPLMQALFLEPRLHIFDARLRPIAEYPLAQCWTNCPSIEGRVADFDRTGRNQLLLVADQPYLFELRSRTVFGRR